VFTGLDHRSPIHEYESRRGVCQAVSVRAQSQENVDECDDARRYSGDCSSNSSDSLHAF
jgi:hypothetical protein